MDTSPEAFASEPTGGGEEAGLAVVHFSTGRLSVAQAGAVDRWRARLRLDKPLPGTDPKPAVLRAAGIDDRPRCSCSDVIAAAVAEFLGKDPAPLDIGLYAEADRQAAGNESPAAPGCQPVSFYLTEALAEQVAQLRAEARAQLDELYGICRIPPRGTIGRMAIDMVVIRAVDQVVAAGVAWAPLVHAEIHRARRDMHKIRRPRR
jgi:hypothetical protein